MAKDVSRQLAQRAEDVARYLLPNGKKIGAEWRAGSTGGESGESLGVHLSGEKSGVWSDFATGDRGDLLDLWAAVRNLTLSAAISDACEYLVVYLNRNSRLISPQTSLSRYKKQLLNYSYHHLLHVI